jgi:cytochrome P450
VDVSPWLRPDAATSPDRSFCHVYGRGKGQAQMIPGWPYSFVAALEPGRTSWTTLLDAVRLGPCDDATTVTATQLREVIHRLQHAGQHKPGDADILIVFDAGNETTKSLIGNGILALLQHPGQSALLRGRPELLKSTVDEALRYDSPLQLTKRLATRDVKIGGKWIREGDQILLCLGAANRDPTVFNRPDEFAITRNVRKHLAFGHGMHGCLGGLLAQLQAEVAFELLYQRAERLELQAERLEWQDHSFIVRGLKRLPVSLGSTR